jgi:ADP-heptose:LPS heptosyltransferase
LDYFIELINTLDHAKFNIIVTGTEAEKARLLRIIQQCLHIKSAVGELSLSDFVALISHADGLLANSTGPLHIAGAFNIHTLGLFPPDKGKDPTRWEALGSHSSYLAAENTEADCMKTITPAQVKKVIDAWI